MKLSPTRRAALAQICMGLSLLTIGWFLIFGSRSPEQSWIMLAMIFLGGAVGAGFAYAADRPLLTGAGLVIAAFGIPTVITLGYLIGGV